MFAWLKKTREILVVYNWKEDPDGISAFTIGNANVRFSGPLDYDRIESIRDGIAKKNNSKRGSVVILNIIPLE